VWSSLGSKFVVNFFAEAADINIHEIRAGIEIVVPDFFDNHHAPAGPPRRTHEKFQQAIFACGQFDVCFPRVALYASAHRVSNPPRAATVDLFSPPRRVSARTRLRVGQFKTVWEDNHPRQRSNPRLVRSLRHARKGAKPAWCFYVRPQLGASTLKPSRPGSIRCPSTHDIKRRACGGEQGIHSIRHQVHRESPLEVPCGQTRPSFFHLQLRARA